METENNVHPTAVRVDDKNDIDEKSLERSFTGNEENPVKEGTGMGGQNFGNNNVTPAGDDKNNPSRTAGYDNAYFARNEPSDEHPEDSNFTSAEQDGAPDYAAAQGITTTGETPKPEPVERGNGENDRPHEEEPYTEGTDDSDEEPNIAGPGELPDQQKVGEEVDNESGT